jgi:hypothetical protein
MVKAGRGEQLMIGKTGMKPNRQLRLPSDVVIMDGTQKVLESIEKKIAKSSKSGKLKPLQTQSKRSV